MGRPGLEGKKLVKKKYHPNSFFQTLIDLKKYIQNHENLRFSSFVSKHKELIPGWSMGINATSVNVLYGAWLERYTAVHMGVKKTKKR